MKKHESDTSYITRITNGTAKSSSWSKMENASGVIYVGSRGPKTEMKFGNGKKKLPPEAAIKKATELPPPQRLAHKKAVAPLSPKKNRPESKYLRVP